MWFNYLWPSVHWTYGRGHVPKIERGKECWSNPSILPRHGQTQVTPAQKQNALATKGHSGTGLDPPTADRSFTVECSSLTIGIGPMYIVA